MTNPYSAPESDITQDEPTQVYGGFWIRLAASLVDSILMMIIIYPVMRLIYGEAVHNKTTFVLGGWDVLFNYILPAVVVILFWIYRSATPGKMLCRLSIVNAADGGKPSTGQLIGRYLAYYLSLIVFGLGFLWVAFDKRKQGWHDKLAGTVVIKNPR